MSTYKGEHLPQIEYYYDGYIYPFIGDADLKTLIEWRTQKLNSDSFWSYSKDARNTYYAHLECIEECCRILFLYPDPKFAISQLNKRQQEKKAEDEAKAKKSEEFMSRLSPEQQKDIARIIEKYKAKMAARRNSLNAQQKK